MSTYTPPTFSNFGKSGLFQVYDKDALEHQVKLVNKTAEGVTFENAVVFTPKQPRGYVKTSFGLRGVVVDAQVHTDASKASTVALKKKNVLKSCPGLNVSATFSSSEKDFSSKPAYGVYETIAADYTRNNFAATAGVTTDAVSNHSVTASAAVGFEGFSLGGDVKLIKTGDSKFEAKSYNAGLAFTKKNYTAALVSDAKFEKLKATVLASRVGDRGQFNVGIQAKVDLQAPKAGAPQREVIVSVEDIVSPNTTYRLAAVNSGVLVGSIDHRLANPSVQLTASVVTAAPSSAFSPFAVSKFGVGLTVGDF